MIRLLLTVLYAIVCNLQPLYYKYLYIKRRNINDPMLSNSKNRHNKIQRAHIRQQTQQRQKQLSLIITTLPCCSNIKLKNENRLPYLLLLVLRISILIVGVLIVFQSDDIYNNKNLFRETVFETNWTNVSYNIYQKVEKSTTAITTTIEKPVITDSIIHNSYIGSLHNENEKAVGGETFRDPIADDTPNINDAVNINESQHNIHEDACYRMKNVDDIRLCYPSQYVKQFNDSQCNTIQNWDDVQRCLMGRFYYNNNTNNQIREVHILGERNSGTKFVTQFLQQCFPSTSPVGIKVHRDLIRSKHFFQPIWTQHDFTRSLVVVVVRDPIEWMAAMREYPYHSPSHIIGFTDNGKVVPLPWSQFVNKTWTTESSAIDNTLTGIDRTSAHCQQRFRYDEVKPCMLNMKSVMGPPWHLPVSKLRGYAPVYEQKRGKPYDHLLQMRSDKIVNWVLQIPLLMKIGGFLVVRYEDILTHGNEFFLKQVYSIINHRPINSDEQKIPDHCSVIEAQPNRIGKRYIPSDFKEWIIKHLDEDTERLIGYR